MNTPTNNSTLLGLHAIELEGKEGLAYDPLSGQIVNLGARLFKCLGLLQTSPATAEQDDAAAYCKLQQLATQLDQLHEAHAKNGLSASTASRTLDRVTLLVTNNCNLRCKYCYAHGSGYGIPRHNMEQTTALDVADFLVRHFDHIGAIVFFGGEPLLNPEVIECVCKRFEVLQSEGKILSLPKFVLITNGTRLTPRTLGVIKRYITHVTVSIDGPQLVHDANRIDEHGNGSYDQVDHFIRTISSLPNLSVSYEATFTEIHLQAGLRTSDVSAYMHATYGLDGTVIEDLALQYAKPSQRTASEARILGIDSEEFTVTGLSNVVRGLLFGQRRSMCPVGRYTVAIDPDGKLYFCHMNVGKNHLCQGSIYGDNIFTARALFEQRYPFLRCIALEAEPCSCCWMRYLCGGCTMEWFYDNDSQQFLSHPKPSYCQQMAINCERIIAGVAQARQNPETWEELKAQFVTSHSFPC